MHKRSTLPVDTGAESWKAASKPGDGSRKRRSTGCAQNEETGPRPGSTRERSLQRPWKEENKDPKLLRLLRSFGNDAHVAHIRRVSCLSGVSGFMRLLGTFG